jgi:hypothetical protein
LSLNLDAIKKQKEQNNNKNNVNSVDYETPLDTLPFDYANTFIFLI